MSGERAGVPALDNADALWPREYPRRPIVGVGAVVVQDSGVVLVKRRHEPLAGRWSLPGGLVEVGESLADAVARETREETGLLVEVGALVEIVERVLRDPDGRIRYHYVLLDYVCRPVGGALGAGTDAADVAIVAPGDLAGYGVAPSTLEVITRALALADPW